MEELLKLENVNFLYEDKYPALKKVTSTFHHGERIAVLGGNGAGKSTFFLCCNGVLRPQSGRIIMKGREISANAKDALQLRQTVGLVFQEPDSQIIAGTVEAEVSFGPMNLHLPAEDVADRVDQALKRMNLAGYEQRAPHYLSGGEKKRVSIADILSMRPEIILLDEPTASLDPENVALLEQTLADLSASGITLAVSTHDVDFAYSFAERALVFCQGEIIMDAPIEQVFANVDVLHRAGLKKPLLYEAAQLLEQRFPELARLPKPRRREELPAYLAHLGLD